VIDPSPQVGISQNIVLHGNITDYLTSEDSYTSDSIVGDRSNGSNSDTDDFPALLHSYDSSTVCCNDADQSTRKPQEPRRFPVRLPTPTSVSSSSLSSYTSTDASASVDAVSALADTVVLSSRVIALRAYGEHCRSWLEGFVPSAPKSRLSEIEGIAIAHQAMRDRAWSFVTIDLGEIEAKQPRDVIQNLLREIKRISDQRPSYFGAYVAKPGMPHLHLALNIAPGSLAWNALDAWAERQNGKWPSRVRFEEITCDKGGLAGVIAYLIGRKNLNRHPGRIMRSNDLIKAVNALAATMPAKARRSAADASEAFQGPDVAPGPLQATPAPSHGLDDSDHPPADRSIRPDEDRSSLQEINSGDLTRQKFSPILLIVDDREIVRLEQCRKEIYVVCEAKACRRPAPGGSVTMAFHNSGDAFGGIHRRYIRHFSPHDPRTLRRRAQGWREVRIRGVISGMGRGPPAQGPPGLGSGLDTRADQGFRTRRARIDQIEQQPSGAA
jgi:hypothetical protein